VSSEGPQRGGNTGDQDGYNISRFNIIPCQTETYDHWLERISLVNPILAMMPIVVSRQREVVCIKRQ